jgi:type VI secretion system protein
MALQVTLVKTPGGVSVPKASHLFNEQGGTLGRAATNSWQLPDPEKFLSSCHCEILWIADGYYLVDRSTNGTFLNGSPEPIGRGVESRLNNGDIFEIGDYRFSVSIPDAMPIASPFGSNEDFFSGHSAPDDNIFGNPFDHQPVVDNTPIFEQPLDPLAMWDKVSKAPAGRVAPQTEAPVVVSTSIDDIFGGFGNELPQVQPDFAPVDVSQHIDQAVAWPNASRENLIPEDWEDDFSELGAAPFNQAPIAAPVHTPAPIQPAVAIAVPNPRADRQPLAERIAAMDTAAVITAPVVPVAPVVPTAIPAAKENIAGENNQPVAVRPDCLLVEAMGLDPARLSDQDIAEITIMTGKLMREVTEGMMGVLRSRTSIKNEFRMNVTTIQPVENNPLKFSVNVDDALENMFVKKSNAYKKPVDAFKEGFQEIAEHQVAMIGGIRQGFESMMERFNPEGLEKNFNKQGRAGLLPGMQKAKYWGCYTEYYSGFVDNIESSFQHLFGSDFVSAYEDQLRRLAAARKKEKQ